MLGRSLTSDALGQWNYGTLQQRLDLGNWGELIKRTLKIAIGPGSLVLVVASFYVRFSRTEWFVVFGLLLCWLSAFLAFFNLHYVHDYYQCANAVFIIAVFALVMFRIMEDFKPRQAWSIMGIVCVISIATFYNSFFSKISDGDWFLDVTNYVQQNTTPDEAIVTFGFDWSSHVAFYSERKSISVAGWGSREDLQTILSDVEHYLGGLRLGAVVIDHEHMPVPQKSLLVELLERESPAKKQDFGKISVYAGFD